MVSPLDKAVYHMEYLMRHKGDLKLKSTDVTGQRSGNLDVYAFLASATLLSLAVACVMARFVFVKAILLASYLQMRRGSEEGIKKEKSA